MKIYRLILPEYENREFTTDRLGYDNVEVINGIWNPDLYSNQEMYKQKYGFELSNQEKYNFQQHRNIWKQFIESNLPYCLIIESNVRINCNYETLLEPTIVFPEDLDIFFPYDRPAYINKRDAHEKKIQNANLREPYLVESYVLKYKWGNSIYYLSRKGAKKLLEIKEIKDRLDNEILNLSQNNNLKLYYASVSWLKMNDIDWREWPERISNMWNSIIAATTWTEQRKEKVKYLLRLVSDMASEINVELILQAGSHLGYVQHGGIIPWDDDVDLGICEDDLSGFLNELSHNNELAFGEIIEEISGEIFYKIWLVDGEKIDGHNYTFPFLDIWIYNKIENDLVFKNGIVCPNSASAPFVGVEFEEASYYIPFNSKEVLNSRYKYWKSKAVIYSWSHLFEKNYFRPLVIPIKTDKNGRMKSLGR